MLQRFSFISFLFKSPWLNLKKTTYKQSHNQWLLLSVFSRKNWPKIYYFLFYWFLNKRSHWSSSLLNFQDCWNWLSYCRLPKSFCYTFTNFFFLLLPSYFWPAPFMTLPSILSAQFQNFNPSYFKKYCKTPNITRLDITASGIILASRYFCFRVFTSIKGN